MSTDFHITTEQDADQRLWARVAGRFAVENASAALADFHGLLQMYHPQELVVDLSDVHYFDSAGAAVFIEVRRYCTEHGCGFSLTGLSDEIKGLLELLDIDALSRPLELTHPEEPSMMVRIGDWAYGFAADARRMLVFLGATVIALLYAVSHPRSIRWREVAFYFEQAGVNAVPILLLIQFLIGMTLAFLGASQLSQFGANIYVADLVGIAMVQELGPLITAIIVTGRSGAAFAAEIGTMKVSEEVDAMTAMGLDTQRFLVVPKLIAVFIAMPGLCLLADLIGIAGGAMIAVTCLDVPLGGYISETYKALNLWLFCQGIIKSLSFAVLIAGVGCMRGFEVRGGAEGVGRSTTSAVVSCIFLIVVVNTLFTIIFQT